MLSTRSWPEPAIRALNIVTRFQKFIVVGAIGLGVNMLMLFLLRELTEIPLRYSSVIAIGISMLVTFTLNERWTWHDRGKGSILSRMAMYVPINTVGLIINTEVLLVLERAGMHYLLANLVGAGLAAVWNFMVNNAITWRS